MEEETPQDFLRAASCPGSARSLPFLLFRDRRQQLRHDLVSGCGSPQEKKTGGKEEVHDDATGRTAEGNEYGCRDNGGCRLRPPGPGKPCMRGRPFEAYAACGGENDYHGRSHDAAPARRLAVTLHGCHDAALRWPGTGGRPALPACRLIPAWCDP